MNLDMVDKQFTGIWPGEYQAIHRHLAGRISSINQGRLILADIIWWGSLPCLVDRARGIRVLL